MRRRSPLHVLVLVLALAACRHGASPLSKTGAATAPAPIRWPVGLPVYDHVVVVVEENKDPEQILGNPGAPYINRVLKAEGALLTRMYAEEHHSQGNYFWLFSGSNQNVGFRDDIPKPGDPPGYPFTTHNLGEQLIAARRSFKGYSEGLPAIGSTVKTDRRTGYARKHVPWISFANVPDGNTVETSSNLRFADFPSNYDALPTVAFVIPNLLDDMHNGSASQSIPAGDVWLHKNLDPYYQWAKQHNGLLILTFDEDSHGPAGLTDPAAPRPERRNRIVTILAGAHVKPGEYAEDQKGNKGVTHVNVLRTLESMYGLGRAGAQQPNALRAGIADDFLITDVFAGPLERTKEKVGIPPKPASPTPPPPPQ